MLDRASIVCSSSRQKKENKRDAREKKLETKKEKKKTYENRIIILLAQENEGKENRATPESKLNIKSCNPGGQLDLLGLRGEAPKRDFENGEKDNISHK